MTGLELRTLFENLIDDSPDITLSYQLLTMAKNLIERRCKLAILEDVDSTQVRNNGDTFTTFHSLPATHRETIKLNVGNLPYIQVPFNQRTLYRAAARRFYIDHKNKQYAICGTNSGPSQTIEHFFLASTPDLTQANEGTNNVITWPSEFQPIVAFWASMVHKGEVDPDAIFLAMSKNDNQTFMDLFNGLVEWDHDIKLAAQDHRGGFEPEEPDYSDQLGTY